MAETEVTGFKGIETVVKMQLYGSFHDKVVITLVFAKFTQL